MKKLTVLFADFKNTLPFEKVFDGFSAFDRSIQWALSCKSDEILILSNDFSLANPDFPVKNGGKYKIISDDNWTCKKVLDCLCSEIQSDISCTVFLAFADCPFLSQNLTESLLENHLESRAEYTFAEGYPYGFSPEVFDSGLLKILKAVAEGNLNISPEESFTREGLFKLMKGDLNSFEIETCLSKKDFRLLRYSFECSSKASLTACKRLFNEKLKTGETKINLSAPALFDVEEVSSFASSVPSIQMTLPFYYDIQLSSSSTLKSIYKPEEKILSAFGKNQNSNMSFKNFCTLIEKIHGFSEECVVGLSLFGEPFLHPDIFAIIEKILSYPEISIFIETDGLSLNNENIGLLSQIIKTSGRKNSVDFAVRLDAFSGSMYEKINGLEKKYFDYALNSVELLQKEFAGHVYPQFTRIKENESELESFYRFWSKKDSPSGGKLVIMKYDSFAGFLEDKKPADLSPLERNCCWHLRRDLCILADGSVPLCRARLSEISGNAITGELSEIWVSRIKEVENHINKSYCECCRNCDEYYTFNF